MITARIFSFGRNFAALAFCTMTLLAIGAVAQAAPVSSQTALTVVKNWLRNNATPMNEPMIGSVHDISTYQTADRSATYHVVNLSPSGFVVVAGDNTIEPILAFGAGGTFCPDPRNPVVDILNKDLPHRLSARSAGVAFAASASGLKRIETKWQALASSTSAGSPIADATSLPNSPGPSDVWVAPIIGSQWNQDISYFGNCYDLYTPNNDVCGCVATALAQMLRFYEWPQTGVGTGSFKVYVDGVITQRSLRGGDGNGGAYNWSNMPLTPDLITTNSPTLQAQYQEIGDICSDAGVAVHMQYTADESSAYFSDWQNALVTTFNYANAMAYYIPGSTTMTMSMIEQTVNSNLDAALPVGLGISGSAGGHAILADGYGYDSGTMYHHLNMGWGSGDYGSQSIWYNLATPDLSTIYDFNVVNTSIYNVYPQGTGEVLSGEVLLNGSPLSGASVVASGGGQQYTATSGGHGIYAFTKLPSNTTYTVKATYNGLIGTIQSAIGQSANGGGCGNLWGQNVTLSGTVTLPIYPASLQNATIQNSYMSTLTSSGGTAPYTFTVTSGSLPSGMSLSSAGVISGTPNAAGTYSFTVKVTDSTTGTGGPFTGSKSYTLGVVAGTTTQFVVTAPSAAQAGKPVSVTVTAEDANNNVTTGYTGIVAFKSSDGAAILPASSKLTNGVGTFSATFNTLGSQSITATDSSASSITGSATTTVTGAAAKFSVTGPSTSIAGAASTYTITALDSSGNMVIGYTGAVKYASTDLSASLPTSGTLIGGTATISVTFKTAGLQKITATDSATSSLTGYEKVTVASGTATRLVVSAPSSVSPGVAFSISVSGFDWYGNAATTLACAVRITSTDPAAVLPAIASLQNGLGTFQVTLNSAGSQTITATDTASTSITGSTTVALKSTVTHLKITAAATSTAGSPISVTVTALNASNAAVTSYTGKVAFTSSDAAAMLPLAATLTNGTGTFSVTLKTAGQQTVTATDTTTRTLTASATVAVSAAAVSRLGVGTTGAVVSGTATTISIRALDAFGNACTSAANIVKLSSTDPLATLTSPVTLQQGLYSGTATLNTAGAQTITATDTTNSALVGSGTIIVASASLAKFGVTIPTTAAAKTPFIMVVSALDAHGNLVTSFTNLVKFTSTDSKAVLPSTVTIRNGLGAFAVTFKTTGSQSITVTDAATGKITGKGTATVQ